MKMEAKQVILSRGLPKTGEVIAYTTGDDGSYEAGWWKGRLNANNKTRFIAKTINGNDVIIDRATGLMWAADGNEAGCNNNSKENRTTQIDYANNLTFADFSNWRMPNINELLSIMDYSRYSPAIDTSFFPNTSSFTYWTSTTWAQNTGLGMVIAFNTGTTTALAKTGDAYLRCVRLGV